MKNLRIDTNLLFTLLLLLLLSLSNLTCSEKVESQKENSENIPKKIPIAMSILHVNINQFVDVHFKDLFEKNGFEKKQGVYENEHCIFKVEIFDQITIRPKFAKKEAPQKFFNLYAFLCTTMKEKYYDLEFNLFSPIAYEGETPEQKVETYVKELSTFSEANLKAPFEGDFSWESEYEEILDFLKNTRQIIKDDDAYSNLRPLLKQFKQDSIKKMNREALKIYFSKKMK